MKEGRGISKKSEIFASDNIESIIQSNPNPLYQVDIFILQLLNTVSSITINLTFNFHQSFAVLYFGSRRWNHMFEFVLDFILFIHH